MMITYAIEVSKTREWAGPTPGDLRNLLQVAASALHLIDQQLDDDLRPLIRVGLTAIRQAAAVAVTPPPVPVHVTRSLPR